jgi:hypothetical protein
VRRLGPLLEACCVEGVAPALDDVVLLEMVAKLKVLDHLVTQLSHGDLLEQPGG